MAKIPAPESVFRFMRWVVLIFVAYMLWHSSFGIIKPATVPATQQATVTKSQDCNATTDNAQNNFSMLAVPLLPSYVPSLRIEDIKEGTGQPAQCGQNAVLDYSYAIRGGAELYKSPLTKTAPTYTIGGSELLAGVSQGIIGMKTGGERTITVPPELAFGTAKDLTAFPFKLPSDIRHTAIAAHVRLLGLSPALPASPMPIRVIDRAIGNGNRMQCGDTVRADISVWKMDGTKVFSTVDKSPATFTLGLSEIPYGIEQGIIGMMEGGARILILPPAYTNPLVIHPASKEPLSAAMNFPPNEVVLVEISLLPALEEAPAAVTVKTPLKK